MGWLNDLENWGDRMIGQPTDEDKATAAAANAADAANVNRQEALQREFAQNGIRWKIDDAATRGISPLAALGAVGSSYSPVHSTFTGAYSTPDQVLPFLSSIMPSIMAMSTPIERAKSIQDLRGSTLQNDLLEAQLKNAQMSTIRANPPMPSTVQYFQEPNGSVSIQPSNEFATATSGNLFSGMDWYLRNKLIPQVTFGAGQPNAINMNGELYTYKPFAGDYSREFPKMNWGNKDVWPEYQGRYRGKRR